MRIHSTRIAALALCATLIGCGGTPPREEVAARPEAGARPEAADGGHGSAGAVPGSYEDWCSEHAVAETACTRCDASRIPAFKAVGDWDAEHGLPRSQCLTCDPNLEIVRPPKPEAD